MPVSQTVFINIVVKGAGNVDIKGVSAPIRDIKDEAAKAEKAISSMYNTAYVQSPKLNKAAKEELALIQSTAQAENRLRDSQISNINKMAAAETKAAQKSANDRLALVQHTANQENKLRNKLAQEAALIEKASFGNMFGDFMLRQVNTMVKALTSMIGVMAMFTLFITIPELIAKGFIALAEAAIRAADEVQQLQITLASLIATNMSFSENATTSFKAAQEWAKSVYLDFVDLATRSIATPKELGIAYQAFLAGGGAGMVKNLNEQVQLTGMLSNAILTLTGRIQPERQLFTEMNALMEGQNRAGAQLIKFLQHQVGDIKTWIAHIKASKNGMEEFTKVLAPFVEAGEVQGKTLTGLTTSIQGFVETLNVAAAKDSSLKLFAGILIDVRDLLNDTEKQLVNTGGKFVDLSDDAQHVVKVFAMLHATLSMLTSMILELFITMKDKGATGLETLEAAILKFAKGIILVFSALEGFTKAGGPFRAFELAQERMKQFSKFVDEAIKSVEKFFATINKPDTEAKLFPEVLTGAELVAFKKLSSELRVLQSEGDVFVKIQEQQREKATSLEREFEKYPEHLKSALGINKQITAELIRQKENELADKAFKSYKNLNDQLRALISPYKELIDLEIQFENDTISLRETLKGQNKEYETQIELLTRIYNMRRESAELDIFNKQIDEFLSATESVNKSIRETEIALKNMYGEAAGKSLSNIAEAEAKIIEETDKLDKMWVKLFQSGINPSKLNAAYEYLNRWADAIKRVAGLKDILASANIGVDKLKTFGDTLSEQLDTYNRFGGSLENIRRSVVELGSSINANSELLNKLVFLAAFGGFKGKDAESLAQTIKSVASALKQAKKELLDFQTSFDPIGSAVQRLESAIRSSMFSSVKSVTMLVNVLKLLAFTMLQNVPQALSEMFSAMFQGKSVTEAFAHFLGQMLTQVGTLCVNTGIAEVALAMTMAGRLMGASLAAGLRLIAVGAAVIAAGAALGSVGSKGASTSSASSGANNNEPQPTYINNNQIAAQQGIQNALELNTLAVNNLNNELSRLSKEKGDVLVSNIVKRNPESVLAPLSTKLKSSLRWQREFGAVMG